MTGTGHGTRSDHGACPAVRPAAGVAGHRRADPAARASEEGSS
jgi:hypothetical protein